MHRCTFLAFFFSLWALFFAFRALSSASRSASARSSAPRILIPANIRIYSNRCPEGGWVIPSSLSIETVEFINRFRWCAYNKSFFIIIRIAIIFVVYINTIAEMLLINSRFAPALSAANGPVRQAAASKAAKPQIRSSRRALLLLSAPLLVPLEARALDTVRIY